MKEESTLICLPKSVCRKETTEIKIRVAVFMLA